MLWKPTLCPFVSHRAYALEADTLPMCQPPSLCSGSRHFTHVSTTEPVCALEADTLPMCQPPSLCSGSRHFAHVSATEPVLWKSTLCPCVSHRAYALEADTLPMCQPPSLCSRSRHFAHVSATERVFGNVHVTITPVSVIWKATQRRLDAKTECCDHVNKALTRFVKDDVFVCLYRISVFLCVSFYVSIPPPSWLFFYLYCLFVYRSTCLFSMLFVLLTHTDVQT